MLRAAAFEDVAGGVSWGLWIEAGNVDVWYFVPYDPGTPGDPLECSLWNS